MDSVGHHRHSSTYDTPKAGFHRARSKSDLTINELEIKKSSFVSCFIQKMHEMEKDFAEIKARYFPQASPRVESNNTEEKITFLKGKLEKINIKNPICDPGLLEKLERIQKLSVNVYSDQEYRSLLSAQIEYVTYGLLKGIFLREDSQKRTADLLDYVNILAIAPAGQNLLAGDKKLFQTLSNAYILSLSKKISLLYPKQDSHETQFAELIQTITTIHEGKLETKAEDIGHLLQGLNEFNRTIQKCLDESVSKIHEELFSLLRPDPHLDFAFNDIKFVPLFVDFELVDDPAKDYRRVCLDKVLTELIKTEEAFCKNVGVIAETGMFAALAKENVINMDELAILRKGWKKLRSSSTQLHSMLTANTETLVHKFESFLGALTPQGLDDHMENCKVLMVNFMESNKILHKIQANPKGKQMLLAFSAINRLDIFDLWIMPVQRPPRYILLVKEVMKLVEIDAVSKRLGYLEKWVRAINFFAPDFSR